MQELEKILEEIKDKLKDIYLDIANNYNISDLQYNGDKVACVASKFRCDAGRRIEKIIRKRMNDDWVSVEERLPEKNEYFVETSSDKDFPNGYYKRLEIAYMTDTIEYVHGYYDGYKWMDKYHDTIKNVVAWRIHEPYRPERSDNHDK